MSTDFFNEAQKQKTSFRICRLGHRNSTTWSSILAPELKYDIVMTEEESLGYQSPISQSEDPGPVFCVLLSHLQCLMGGDRKCQVFQPSLERLTQD